MVNASLFDFSSQKVLMRICGLGHVHPEELPDMFKMSDHIPIVLGLDDE